MISMNHDTIEREMFLEHIPCGTNRTTPACDRDLPASSGARPIDDNDHRRPVLPIPDPPTPPNTIRITVLCVKAGIILYCRAVHACDRDLPIVWYLGERHGTIRHPGTMTPPARQLR